MSSFGRAGILGGVGVAEHPAADAKHQRPITAHEHFNGGVVGIGQEPVQELAIRQRRLGAIADQVAEVVQERA